MTFERIENKKEGLLNEHIESGRLILIPISMNYKEELFEEFTEEITTFMYPSPNKDISEVEKFISSSVDGLQNGSNLQMIALEKENKEFLGCVGLHNVDTSTPEMGVWLKKSAHGRAYGKEAMVAIKEWADKNLNYDYILYPVDEKNIPSRKIPESLGGKVERKYEQKTPDGRTLNLMEYRIYPK